MWEAHHRKEFEDLKHELSEQSLLRYHDPTKKVVLHCDASLKGLGAALLQPGPDGELRPVAYASKSLTMTEQRYACIEREMLAIVFGARRFHTYLFGRQFTVVTDHRPLVMIMDKPVTAAPARLQRMLIELHGYNITLEFSKGTNHLLADGLSRFPTQSNSAQLELDVRVDAVRFSPTKLDQVREAIEQNQTLRDLCETICHGWPETIKDLHTELRPFWGMRDIMAVSNGLIFKGGPTRHTPDNADQHSRAAPHCTPRQGENNTDGQGCCILAQYGQRYRQAHCCMHPLSKTPAITDPRNPAST